MIDGFRVDTLKDKNNNVTHFKGYPRRPGQIIEYLTSICDGSSLNGFFGSFPTVTVASQMTVTATNTIIPGSLIKYQPPPGTKKVVYKFSFSSYWVQAHAINHYRFYIDDKEIERARHNRSMQYNENRYDFMWVININGVNNNTYGSVENWDALRKIHMAVRFYGGSNYNNLFGTTYWDGTSGNQFSYPVISLIAIA